MPNQTFFNLSHEKKHRITQGAKEVFAQKHYSNVTIDSIVEKADIPKGSFYQYFHNKDDLFKHVFKDIGTDKSNFLLDIANESNESFSSLITRLVLESSKFENRDETMIALKGRFLKECPQSVKEDILSDIMPDTMKLFETIIEAYVKKGDFRADIDTKAASFTITSALLNIEKYSDEEGFDYGQAIINICNTLELGLRKYE
ncbi:MAG: TetR/AcrR family transcriptional regulator [Bacillota bacterium]